jgi:hypothetical protein
MRMPIGKDKPEFDLRDTMNTYHLGCQLDSWIVLLLGVWYIVIKTYIVVSMRWTILLNQPLSRAAHRPYTHIYIAPSPPLGHHHFPYYYTNIHPILSPQPIQALTAVHRLERLEHALRGVKLWLLTDQCHEEEAKARISTVQECKDIKSRTAITQFNRSKESTISRLR